MIYPGTLSGLVQAAHFMVALHEHEGGDETAVTATFERALGYLTWLEASGRGRVFCAEEDGQVLGTIVVEFSAPGAVVGGLWCTREAPPKTALWLMFSASCHIRCHGCTQVFIVTNTYKNRRRRLYKAMGFRPVVSLGQSTLLWATLDDVDKALDERLVKHGQHR
jgi:hypothetical protein